MTQEHTASADGEESSLSHMHASFQHKCVCLGICLSFKKLSAFARAAGLSVYFKISRTMAKHGVEKNPCLMTQCSCPVNEGRYECLLS